MPSKPIKNTIQADGTEISIYSNINRDDYISITDLAKRKNSTAPKDVVKNWLRIRSTIEYLGLWEKLNNPNFKGVEFDSFKTQAGSNAFTLSPQQWVKATGAIGIISKSGRYDGGTYAHKDIAFEFAAWISPEFKLYVIQDYQRLKSTDSHQHALDWSVNRLLSKANYRIHTDAIKENLISENITEREKGFIYANEADLLNVALFGKTARQWKDEHKQAQGNIRDNASIEELLVLTNLENMNALLIQQGVAEMDRLQQLRKISRQQLLTLSQQKSTSELKSLNDQLQLKE